VRKIPADGAIEVTMHDGSSVRFRSVPEGYDPHDRRRSKSTFATAKVAGKIVTGLLYVDETGRELHEMNATPREHCSKIPYATLCPDPRNWRRCKRISLGAEGQLRLHQTIEPRTRG